MRIRLVIIFTSLLSISFGQINPVSPNLPFYKFIHYDLNRFELVEQNTAFKLLFSKFDSLLIRGTNQINIVHIGGSHIQADIYTHRMRQELQSLYPGILGSRGFFFPFKIAQTNSPSNLKMGYTGEWLTSKNTNPLPGSVLGLSGITSILASDSGSINLIAVYDSLKRYDFNRIRIYCNATADSSVRLIYPDHTVSQVTLNYEAGYIEYMLNQYTDTLSLVMFRGDSLNPFRLYGLSLDNDDPGVIYHAIGVNGAMLKSYLQCSLFSEQLRSLRPDWIIISIGTNEGNTRKFDETAYRNDYIRMINLIRSAAPEAAVLLTVPNDSYLLKRYTNNNTAVIRKVIYELAQANGCAVWDFYSVMGGLNSSTTWYNNGLMAKDHIHFNKTGYLVKGELLFNAFLESWMGADNKR